MARSRNVKPGFFSNEQLANCPMEARLLFIALWTLSDRAGKLEDRPGKIKVFAFPFDPFSVHQVDEWLDNLAAEKLIARYSVGSERVIFITNFKKHQNPHHLEKPSVLPDMPGIIPGQGSPESEIRKVQDSDFSETYTEKVPDMSEKKSSGSRRKNVLIPDSLIPDSLIPDSRHSAALAETTPSESDPAYWVEQFIDLHPKPCDPRFIVTFCNDQLHRLGEDPGRYSAFMGVVADGLGLWREYWLASGTQYAIPLEKWLAGGGWKKVPPAASVPVHRGPVDLKAEEEPYAR